MTRNRLFRFGLPMLAFIALVFAVLSVSRSNSTTNAPRTVAEVTSAQSQSAIVAALGRVEPVGGLRSVGSEITGTIAELAVSVGTKVEPGDVLFRLDSRAALRRVAEREAELAAARASLAQTEAQAATGRADLAAATARAGAAEATLAEVARDLAVAQQLSDRNAAAGRDVERRAAALALALADRDIARAEIARVEVALARLDPAEGADQIAAVAAVTEARQRLDTAQSDLGALTITAQEAGVILSINLRAGETARPASTVMTIAAGDGAILRVLVEEADFGRLDTTRPALAVPRGSAGQEIALVYLATELQVLPNRELSGRADDRIDTRVAEVLFRLPPGFNALYGQTFDVTLPAVERAASTERPATETDTITQSG